MERRTQRATAVLAAPLLFAVGEVAWAELADSTVVAHWTWPQSLSTTVDEAGKPVVAGAALAREACAPEVVAFHAGSGLRFSRKRSTVATVADPVPLEITGALTICVVAQFAAPVEGKSPFVSKWFTQNGWRSYELGVLTNQRLFFDLSGSGNWPADAVELTTPRSLPGDTPYFVSAVYEPGARMALYVNGHLFGEVTERVPAAIFDSPTPVLLGNRHKSLKDCALEGVLGDVWIFDRALSAAEIRAMAEATGLTEEPRAAVDVDRPLDLDAAKARARKWYERLLDPAGQYGAYRMTPTSPPDMYASADVAWSRYIMDDLDLTERQRAEWIDYLQDQQNEADGTYRHRTGHCQTHAFCHATGALLMLGGTHRHRPALLDRYAEVDQIDEWLDGINWVRQWGGSHDIWGAGLPLVCSPQTPNVWREAFFGWLNRELNPSTGFWRIGVESSRPMEYLGGAFHIWPLYVADGRPIPYPERVIDSVLKLQSPEGSWGGFGYGTMDGAWVLGQLLQATEYRRSDVRAALKRCRDGLLELLVLTPHAFLSSAHSTESRLATLSILQEALPEQFTSSTPWRNPWHRRELFAIEYRR